ncbi:MAG: Rrf2 family transcriptional regulator [Clostridia bacterium]|nr:Rrf2 family transcriptional regulator [Clostridia bacterium]
MMISTKGRYLLRVMLDLAERNADHYVPMKEIAEHQGLSLKYLERIMPVLTKHGLVEGIHGKGGGYRLTRPTNQYSVGEILRLAEGELAPIACPECGGEHCKRAKECLTLPMWLQFNQLVNDYFDGITLADLLAGTLSD